MKCYNEKIEDSLVILIEVLIKNRWRILIDRIFN